MPGLTRLMPRLLATNGIVCLVLAVSILCLAWLAEFASTFKSRYSGAH